MDIEHLLSVKNRSELRAWFLENHLTQKLCWVVVSMTPKLDTLLYLDAVEEALCFGWIDGIKKRTPDNLTAQRFSPRAKKSSWTELNKERVRRLERLGLMTPQGRTVLPDMREDAFVIDPVIMQRLKEDSQAYAHFLAFPPLYQRIRIDTIQSVKAEPELFRQRLEKFIRQTRENKMYGGWNDNGRLLQSLGGPSPSFNTGELKNQ